MATAGAVALMLGLLAMGLGLSPADEAVAGENGGCITFEADGGFATESPAAETPTCTPTQGGTIRTATPDVPDDTPTSPPEDTATTAPSTPASPTSPGGDAGAGGVQPPDTGTGTTSSPTWLFGVGLIAATAGAAALLGGMRRRQT
jgi:hypothetical protein